MEKIETNWSDLALQGAENKVTEGYVYVGNGTQSLNDFFGNIPLRREEKHLPWRTPDGGHGYGGWAEHCEYAVTVENWEKATGLSYKTVMGEETKETPDWAEIAKQRTDLPEGHVYVGAGTDDLPKLFTISAGFDTCGKNGWETRGPFCGNWNSYYYGATIENWEKVTGLNYSETVGEVVKPVTEETARDWVALAREGINLGVNPSLDVVYVGHGDNVNPLRKIFNGAHIMMFEGKGFQSGSFFWAGTATDGHYGVVTEEWERVTGLNYKDIIAESATKEETKKETMETPKKIQRAFIKYSPARRAMIEELMKTKKINFQNSPDHSAQLFFNEGGVGTTNYDTPYLNNIGYVEVTLSQFIGLLEELPEKPKSVEIKVQDFDTHVFADKIEIGCKTLTLAEFEKIQAIIEEKRKSEEFTTAQGMRVSIDSTTVRGDGYNFPFSDFDAIQGALKTL